MWRTSSRRRRARPGKPEAATGRATLIPAGAFLLSGVLVALIAWALYPAEHTPSRADPVLASVTSKRTISSLSITILDPLTSPDSAEVVVHAEAVPNSTPEQRAMVHIVLPDALLVPGQAGQVTCAPTCRSANEFGQGTTMMRTRFEFQPVWTSHPDGGPTVDVDLSVPLADLARDVDGAADVLQVPGMNCGEATCRGSVPLVAVDHSTSLAPNAMAVSEFYYPALKGYDWQSSITPYPNADVGIVFSYPVQSFPTTGFLPQFAADGTDSSVENTTTFRIFLSGALAGLAGSLALAAAQDGLTVLRERKHPARA